MFITTWPIWHCSYLRSSWKTYCFYLYFQNSYLTWKAEEMQIYYYYFFLVLQSFIRKGNVNVSQLHLCLIRHNYLSTFTQKRGNSRLLLNFISPRKWCSRVKLFPARSVSGFMTCMFLEIETRFRRKGCYQSPVSLDSLGTWGTALFKHPCL